MKGVKIFLFFTCLNCFSTLAGQNPTFGDISAFKKCSYLNKKSSFYFQLNRNNYQEVKNLIAHISILREQSELEFFNLEATPSNGWMCVGDLSPSKNTSTFKLSQINNEVKAGDHMVSSIFVEYCNQTASHQNNSVGFDPIYQKIVDVDTKGMTTNKVVFQDEKLYVVGSFFIQTNDSETLLDAIQIKNNGTLSEKNHIKDDALQLYFKDASINPNSDFDDKAKNIGTLRGFNYPEGNDNDNIFSALNINHPIHNNGYFYVVIKGSDLNDIEKNQTISFSIEENGVTLINKNSNEFSPVFINKLNITSQSEIPLPLDLISFEGWDNKYGVSLKWSSAFEEKVQTFHIEWSNDNKKWIEIATIFPLEEGEQGVPYFYEDERLVYGNMYYRLKQVENQGVISYSKVLPIKRINKLEYNIYPNPLYDKLYIVNNTGEILTRNLLITTQTGGKVFEKPLSSYNDLDLSNLPVGTYFIIIDDKVTPIIKQ